jgi:hypothetical protein
MVRFSTLAILVVGLAVTPVAAQAFQQISQKATATRAQQGERLICRYVDETGSVARRRRQCFTRTEWDRIAEAARANGTRMMSDHAAGMTSN